MRALRIVQVAVLMAVILLTFAGCSLLGIKGFQDDFENGMSTVWTTYGGNWTTMDGELHVDAGEGYKCLADQPDFTDLILETDVISEGDAANAETGVVFRVTSPGVGVDNYCGYFAGITVSGNAVILGKADGGWTELARVALDTALVKGKKYRLKVVADGARLRVYLVDMMNPKIDLVDDAWFHGFAGLRSHLTASRYDNVIATNILF